MANELHVDDPSGLFDPDPDQAGSMPHAAESKPSETVTVYPAEGKASETAQALLDAAGEGNEHVVKSVDGAFEVPVEVADAASLPEAEVVHAGDDSDNSSPTPKKAPAKKAAARKAPARKATR